MDADCYSGFRAQGHGLSSLLAGGSLPPSSTADWFLVGNKGISSPYTPYILYAPIPD